MQDYKVCTVVCTLNRTQLFRMQLKSSKLDVGYVLALALTHVRVRELFGLALTSAERDTYLAKSFEGVNVVDLMERLLWPEESFFSQHSVTKVDLGFIHALCRADTIPDTLAGFEKHFELVQLAGNNVFTFRPSVVDFFFVDSTAELVLSVDNMDELFESAICLMREIE